MQIDKRSGKPIVEISHSGLASFGSCPKRFAFRKMIITRDDTRISGDAADAGSALHEGLQEYMRSRDVDRALEALARNHPIELQNTEKASQYSLEAVSQTLLHTIEREPEDGSMNITEYDLATFVKDGVSIPATEIAFLVEIELEHLVFHQRGYIDLVVRHPFSQRYLAVDIKTTTATAKVNFATKYKWDYQTTSYGIPLNALLGERENFEVGIYGVILSDRAPQTFFPTFERRRSDVEAYQYYLVDTCELIQRYWLRGRFPRHPSACMSYGKPCYYINDCIAERLQDMQMQINPSMIGTDTDAPRGKAFNPVFTARLEA